MNSSPPSIASESKKNVFVEGIPVSDRAVRTHHFRHGIRTLMNCRQPWPKSMIPSNAGQGPPVCMSASSSQMPSAMTSTAFVLTNKMAITQLAIAYCHELVESPSHQEAFFGRRPLTHADEVSSPQTKGYTDSKLQKNIPLIFWPQPDSTGLPQS